MTSIYEKNHVEILQLADNLYLRKSDMKLRSQCNSVYLVGRHSVTAVDISREQSAQEMREEVQELFGKPIRHILITHGHNDHVQGLPSFLDDDVTVIASQRYLVRMDPALKQRRATFVGVEGECPITIDGVDLHLKTPPGIMHSREDLFIHIPSLQAVCVGDCVIDFKEFYCLDANVENWVRCLQSQFGERDRLLLPGHGMPMSNEDIPAMCESIEAVLFAGKELVAAMPQEEIDGISAEFVNRRVDNFLEQGSPKAVLIRERAKEDATRVLRMMVWHLVHKQIH